MAVTKIDWVTHKEVIYGLAAGYTLSNKGLREGLMDIGVEITTEAPIAMHLCHPENFHPVKGKKNVLYTMFEMHPLPREFRIAFKKADLIVTPSKFCADLFKMHTKKPVRVSKLGFDPYIYKFKHREWNRETQPFSWLWVGAPNPRKGWPALVSAWAWLTKFSRDLEGGGFANPEFAELIMKTSTMQSKGDIEVHPNYPNIVSDSRKYKRVSDMNMLYHDAHAFVLPTQGEGFGLTLLEAAATGLPVVTSKYGGQVDFLSEEDTFFHEYTFERMKDKYGVKLDAACADVPSLAKQMLAVMDNYDEARLKATRQAIRLREEWTWEKAAQELVSTIEAENWQFQRD